MSGWHFFLYHQQSRANFVSGLSHRQKIGAPGGRGRPARPSPKEVDASVASPVIAALAKRLLHCVTPATPRFSIGAVWPARNPGVALVMTRLDTVAMTRFLAELSQDVAPGAHGVVLMDKAGCGILPASRACPRTSAWCSCRPTRPSSTRSSDCGCICATIACPTASFTPPRRSSTAAAKLGSGCSPKPARICSLCSHPWLEKVGI
jgi:hypothetical protein